jgi:hypothetical protein
MGQWQGISNDIKGLMAGFSKYVYQNELIYPDLLPDIRKGNTIFISSDYSGQHNASRYETYTFVLVDFEKCKTWEIYRRDWRNHFLNDGRRLSYKNLNDKKCKSALKPFLDTTHFIPGLIAAVLIDKRIPTIFSTVDTITSESPLFKIYSQWKKPIFEKLMRIIHFASLFLSGLSRPNQNVIWISDEDDIVPNDERLRDATNLFGTISSNYLVHNLGHFRWGTTKIDTGDRMLEDLVTIADLVSGSLAAEFSLYAKRNTLPRSNLIIPPPQNIPRKNKVIMDWFSDNSRMLKRIVFSIEPSEDQERFNLKQIRFHGTRDFLPMNYPFL